MDNLWQNFVSTGIISKTDDTMTDLQKALTEKK